MRRKIFFYPVPGQTDRTYWKSGIHACSDRSTTLLLAEYSDSSGKAVPSEGYRLSEYKRDPASSTFNHGGATTHFRKSPWVVVSVEEYVANVEGMQKYSEVAICYCDYLPLPEEENPWIEMQRSMLSLNSFAGDKQAFEAFVSGLSPAERECYQIIEFDRAGTSIDPC
ncbi:MAG: hypothetical protein WBD58_18100 [Geitlerinemataceae cyanobacterium]